jgi:small neutral amino acid transporter SnatA (MarC family)
VLSRVTGRTTRRAALIILAVDLLGAATLLTLNLTTDVTESTGGLFILGVAVVVVVGALAYTHRPR